MQMHPSTDIVATQTTCAMLDCHGLHWAPLWLKIMMKGTTSNLFLHNQHSSMLYWHHQHARRMC